MVNRRETEDFNCTVQNSAVQVFVLIRAYQAPYGAYTFSITQVGARPGDENTPVIATK